MARSTFSFLLGATTGLTIGFLLSSEERIRLQRKTIQQIKHLRKEYEGPIKHEIQKLGHFLKTRLNKHQPAEV